MNKAARSNFVNLQRSLIKQAVERDSHGKLGPAVTLYCEALEHFLPAIECTCIVYGYQLCYTYIYTAIHFTIIHSNSLLEVVLQLCHLKARIYI